MNFQFTVLSFSVIKENTVLEDRGRHGEASNFAVIIVVVDAYSWHHGLLLVDMLDFLFHRYVFFSLSNLLDVKFRRLNSTTFLS